MRMFATIEPSPAMWKKGAVRKPTSESSNIFIARMQVSACSCMLRWESSTPFGRPVVPEVYMISAVDSSLTSGSSIGPCAARNSSYATWPSVASGSPPSRR